MPEVELQKDPIGSGRGKTLQEQAESSYSRVKQRIHEKYYIPPYRPTNRNWEMTFASLGYNRRTIEKFWRLFCQINHCTRAIQLEHFLEHFNLDWTPWTERCFKHFDTTGGGDIDFLEFMISVWNVCTFKIDSLSNFTFDMYDLDGDGELSIPEIETMVEELFGNGGGKQCLKDALEFAEARGGALNLNSFIAFTGSHQMLLFPIFQIQRKLQRRVFGIRFWKKVERKAKENFNERNKNEFNPRHVQILLRTYQTGGAAAVLSHTGDPNKGLREWYDNQKDNDNEVEVEEEGGNSGPTGRWNLLKDKVNKKAKATEQWGGVKRGILDGQVMKQHTLNRMKEFKANKSFRRNDANKASGDTGAGGATKCNTPSERPASANLPSNVAKDLARIRATRRGKADVERPTNSHNMTSNDGQARPPSAGLPDNVADDLKRIRARRASKAADGVEATGNENASSTNDRPASANLPDNVAADLKRIRERQARRKTRGNQRSTVESSADESIAPSNPGARPPSADLPANVAADLQRIRARRTQNPARRATKTKRRDRPRSRQKSTHTNVRQRQAGTMFFKSEDGENKGWLE